MKTGWRRQTFINALRIVFVMGTATVTLGTGLAADDPNAAGSSPTFAKDVAPILQRSCQNCHRPDAMAPMSLLTYRDARPWARSIKQKVVGRQMPPWFLEKTVGIQKFKDDISLSDEEIATIAKWADSGAPEGDPSDMPPPLKFPDATTWQIGEPDLILTSEEFTVPLSGPDMWIDHFVDSTLTEDRYIRAIEFKPGKKSYRVVHHAVESLITPGDEERVFERRSEDRDVKTTLTIYNIGKRADFLPEGTGRLIKAGSTIQFNLHLHPYGEVIKDRVSLGLKFYPKGYVPKHLYRVSTFGGGNGYDIDIPAETDDVRTDGFEIFASPVRLINFNPHMHSRGKRQCIEVIYPTGGREVLNCAGFSFGWLAVYNWADDVAPLLPAGSVLHVVNWHNNSASNKNNPDPRLWVGHGERTIDEMSLATTAWSPLTEAEYDQELQQRGQSRPPDTRQSRIRR